MKIRWLLIFLLLFPGAAGRLQAGKTEGPVYIISIRQEIGPALVYHIRRAVKEAIDARASLLVIDMDTNGGRVDSTQEIIEVLNRFPGETITYVNTKAFSAGAFIAVATQKIYMAPQSIIGAAAPIMMVPGGAPQDIPNTMEAKMTSALRGLVRLSAQKNGHNPEVIEAMVDKNKELIIDGKKLNEKGQILTLTHTEAETTYGSPPRPLLSAGTVATLDDLIKKTGHGSAVQVRVQPTGAEKLATWINAIAPILLIIGVIGIWMELKTPGFGLPGVVGIGAFLLYFLGGFVAGFSGMEWFLVFVLGLGLVLAELFAFPGTIFLGLAGGVLILVALIMAMVDLYPGSPSFPTWPQLALPMRHISLALIGSVVAVVLLARWLPKTSVYSELVSTSASGVKSVAAQNRSHQSQLGSEGVTLAPLRPGGKARFGDLTLDVISQGEMISKGEKVRIIGHSGTEAVVERC